MFLAKAQQQLTEFQKLRNKSELSGHSLKLACFAICTLVHGKPEIETSKIVIHCYYNNDSQRVTWTAFAILVMCVF